MNNKSLEKKGI